MTIAYSQLKWMAMAEKDGGEITGAQVRAGRAFLKWSVADLAERAGVGTSTVKAIEAAEDAPATIQDALQWRTDARALSIQAIAKALRAAGVTFLSDDGKAGAGVRAKRVAKAGR